MQTTVRHVCLFLVLVSGPVFAADIETLFPNASLIERVKTRADVDLAGVAALKEGHIIDGFAVWETSDDTYGAISLRYAISAAGDFFVGAEGNAQALIALLADNRGISTTLGTWDNLAFVAADDYIHPLVQLDERANALAAFLRAEFWTLADADVLSTDLRRVRENAIPSGYFEELSFALYNRMGAPIHLVASMLHMAQSTTRLSGGPHRGTPMNRWPAWPYKNTMNHLWNPKTADTLDGSGTRTFTLSVSGRTVAYHANTDGDNGNAGSVEINGRVVTSFRNWDSGSHPVTRNAEIASSVRLSVSNNWSEGYAWFRFAALGGTIDVGNVAQSPTGGLSGNRPPLQTTIAEGWNGAAAPDPDFLAGLGRHVRVAAGGGQVALTTLNTDGDLLVLTDIDGHRQWVGLTFGGAERVKPSDMGDIWFDPKDGLLYVAVPAATGVLLYRRESGGSWTEIDLTQAVVGTATPIVEGLTQFLTPDLAKGFDGQPLFDVNGNPIYPIPAQDRNNVNIAGLNPDGDLVLYAQRRDTIDGPSHWTYTNITQEHLIPNGQALPEWQDDIIAYATPWNGWNIAGLNGEGEIIAVWTSPERDGVWATSNLSRISGTPRLEGGLTAYVNWGINLTGVLPNGHLGVTWWSPQLEQERRAAGRSDIWAFTDLSSFAGGPGLQANTIANYTTPNWPSNNIAGITEDDQLVIYWWSPENAEQGHPEWRIANLTQTLPTAEVPDGQLTAIAGRDGSFSIQGVSEAGEVLRYLWSGDTDWTFQNVSQDAERRAQHQDTIVYRMQTGATIDVQALPGILSYPIEVRGDTATWKQPFLDQIQGWNSTWGNYRLVGGTSLQIAFSVTSSGELRLRTESTDKNDHLLVLLRHGWDQPDPHRNGFLHGMARGLYNRLLEHGAVSGSAPQPDDLDSVPITQLNFFSEDISVLTSNLINHQMDYSWFDEANRPRQTKANAKWSPIANRPDQNANLSRSFDIRHDNVTSGAYYLQAWADNGMNSRTRISGLTDVDDYYSTFRAHETECSRAGGWCEARNRNCCSMRLMAKGSVPTHVALDAYTTWSDVQPGVSIAAFGSIEAFNPQESPSPGDDGNPVPVRWRYPAHGLQ